MVNLLILKHVIFQLLEFFVFLIDTSKVAPNILRSNTAAS